MDDLGSGADLPVVPGLGDLDDMLRNANDIATQLEDSISGFTGGRGDVASMMSALSRLDGIPTNMSDAMRQMPELFEQLVSIPDIPGIPVNMSWAIRHLPNLLNDVQNTPTDLTSLLRSLPPGALPTLPSMPGVPANLTEALRHVDEVMGFLPFTPPIPGMPPGTMSALRQMPMLIGALPAVAGHLNLPPNATAILTEWPDMLSGAVPNTTLPQMPNITLPFHLPGFSIPGLPGFNVPPGLNTAAANNQGDARPRIERAFGLPNTHHTARGEASLLSKEERSPSNAEAPQAVAPPPSIDEMHVVARRRLSRSPRGRKLLEIIDSVADKAEAHAAAKREWASHLRTMTRATKASGGAHVPIGLHQLHDAVHGATHLHQLLKGATSLQAITTTSAFADIGGTAIGANVAHASNDWSWISHAGMTMMMGLGGTSAPPVSVLNFNGTAPVDGIGVTHMVSLTAPIIGYGVTRHEVGSFTARSVPVDELQNNPETGDINSTQAGDFFARAGHTPAIASCAGFGYLHYVDKSEAPEAPMLFQPSGLTHFNWLLDAGSRPDGTRRTFCPQLDAMPDQRLVVDAAGNEVRRYGRAGVSSLVFDRSGDVAMAEFAPSGGTPRARRARRTIEDSCPADPLALMRTEVAPLCRESYLATGQTSPFTSKALSGGLDPLREIPQMIVRDRQGNPLSGKYCTIEDVGDGGAYWDMLDPSPFTLDYTCGPSDSDGVLTIENLSLHGGTSRKVVFRIRVDGVDATPSDTASWRFDTEVYYLSTDAPSGIHNGVLLAGGHSSLGLFVLLSLFVMSLNALSLRYGSYQRAPLMMRLVGLLSLLALTYTTSAFFSRHLMLGARDIPGKNVGRISLLGMRDMVATSANNVTPGMWFMGLIAMVLAAFCTASAAQLWLQDQMDALVEAWSRFTHKTGIDAGTRKLKKFTKEKAPGFVDRMAAVREKTREVAAKPLSFCQRLQPGKDNFIVKRLAPFFEFKETYDGELEPPPTLNLLGTTIKHPFEARGLRRQRCARNYVRKLFRGRAWLRAELEKEQNVIVERNQNGFTLLLSRLFGLPTSVHPHLPYERSNDFFYPERFYYSCILALWFQVLISLALIYATRYMRGALISIGDRIIVLDAMAQTHSSSSSLHGLGAQSTMPLAALAISAAVNTYNMISTDSTAMNIAVTLRNDSLMWATPAAVAAGFICFFVHFLMWRAFFRRYRKRLFMMRTGRYFFDRTKMDETAGSSFIGYQVAFMVFSTGVVMTFFFTIISAVGGASVALVGGGGEPPINPDTGEPMITEPTFNQDLGTILNVPHTPDREIFPPPPPPPNFADAYTIYAQQLTGRLRIAGVPTFMWWCVIAFTFQWVFNNYVWFQPLARTRTGDISNRWLRLRFWYAVYEYILILPNVAIGIVFILLRAFFSLILWGYYTFSIDICLVPSATSVESWDPGYTAYVAAARNDHRYNNPIVMVFVGKLQEELKERRLESGRIKLRHNLQRNAARRKAGMKTLTEEMLPKDRPPADFDPDLEEAAAKGVGGAVQRFLKPVKTCLDAGAEYRHDDLDDLTDDGTGVPAAKDEIEACHRYRRVCRRWQLLKLMHINPSMRNTRACLKATHDLPQINDADVFANMGKGTLEAVGKVGSAAKELSDKTGDVIQRSATRVRNSASPVFGRQAAQAPPAQGPFRDADGNFAATEEQARQPWSGLKLPFELPRLPFT